MAYIELVDRIEDSANDETSAPELKEDNAAQLSRISFRYIPV